uniref:PTBP1-like RNA recognition motif 2 domain-containing protein n=1 Tax=Glossina palpalis gambiensis TaxID=67801 RepID=A0A1B0ARR5_9MUSC
MKRQHEIMQLTSYTDVLHKICNPHGQVLRIVIFKKNGVQAMVEFDSLDAATRARENLNGADIYSGCCTLKIDFAKPEKLNVYKNEPDTSWDYTLTTVSNNSKDILNLLTDGNAFQIKCSLLVLNYCGCYSTILQQIVVVLRPVCTNATDLIGA